MAKLTKFNKPAKIRLSGSKNFSSLILIVVMAGFVGYIGYRLIASYAAAGPSIKLTIKDNSNGAIAPVSQSSTSSTPPAAPTLTVNQNDGLQFTWTSANTLSCKKWRDWAADDGSAQGSGLPLTGDTDRGNRDTKTTTSKDIFMTCYGANTAEVEVHIYLKINAPIVTPPPNNPPPNNPPPSNPPSSSPGSSSGSTKHSSSGNGVSTASPPTASDPGPDAPSNFSANSNVVGVILNWSAASGGSGALTYTIDRSIDQADWTNVASGLTGSVYADTSSDFGMTYYYRLQTIDAQNVGSPYIQTQVTTQDFSSNVSGDGNQLTSDDGAVTATIPAGAFDNSASCAIVNQSPDQQQKSSKKGPIIVLGPYSLACRTADDNTLTNFNKPIAFTAKISSSDRKKYHGFDAESQSGSTWKLIKGSKYNSKDGSVSFALSTAAVFAIAGSKGTSLSTYIVIFIFLAVVGFGGYVLYRRKDSIVEWFYQH